MYAKILLPIDGSVLSVVAVPHAQALAEAFNSTVHILTVVLPPAGRSGGAFRVAAAVLGSHEIPSSAEDMDVSQHPIYKESEMASLEAEAKARLLPVAEGMQARGIKTEVVVTFGRAASGILRYAAEAGVELIVMSTHGEGGPTAFAYGPTADRVARRAAVPVLLIRPEEVTNILPLMPGLA